MFNNNVSNNNFGLKSNILNQKQNGFGLGSKSDMNAYYAKKGEPMYMNEMDSNEDGVVSFEEFKGYCEDNDISSKDMIRMVEMANSYHTMVSQKNASKNIQGKEENNSMPEFVYAKLGDAKYDELMDINSNEIVTYREYIEYCEEHLSQIEPKSDTKIEETEDGKFETKSMSKAVNAYSSAEYEQAPGMYELVA